jgi:hypothetical protein
MTFYEFKTSPLHSTVDLIAFLKKSINEADFVLVDDERNVVRLDLQSQLEPDEIAIPEDHIAAICNLHVLTPDGENGVAAAFTEASFLLPVPPNSISQKLMEYRQRLRKREGINE